MNEFIISGMRGNVVWLGVVRSTLKSIDGCSTPINCYLNNIWVLNTPWLVRVLSTHY